MYSCVVIAIFRVIYISRVKLSTDVTGTMTPTIFLFALEPNLAILCVSIPMLRPLYTRWRSRHTSSRLRDPNSVRSGSLGISKATGLRSVCMPSAMRKDVNEEADDHATQAAPQWEMDEYYRPVDKTGIHQTTTCTVVDTTGAGNWIDDPDTSSEKSLTSKGNAIPGVIGVKTQWRVERK
jgi:hypothetical protein